MAQVPARRNWIIGPDGRPFGIKDLPCVRTVRWVRSRKVAVATAVWGGMLTAEEMCQRYRLTRDELDEWMRLLPQAGALAAEPRLYATGAGA